MVQVHLPRFPLRLWQRADAHHEAIRREMEIIRGGTQRDSVPNRLLDLIEDYEEQYGPAADLTWAEIKEAAERGEESIDVTFTVPAEAAEAAATLAAMLAEVDEFCRAGEHLMTLATPPELVAFRGWLLGEFTRQIENRDPPMSWEEYRRENLPAPNSSSVGRAGGKGSEMIVFEGSLDLATVGELRDQIQQVRAGSPQEIVVDLTGVGFVDSVGIGLLVTTRNRLVEEGVHLRLIVPARIKELLRLTGLTELLHPEDPAPL